MKNLLGAKVTGDGIVETCLKFLAPTIKTKIEQLGMGLTHQRECTMIAGPCVVGRACTIAYACAMGGIEMGFQLLTYGLCLWRYNQEELMGRDGLCQFDIGVLNVIQIGMPICFLVRPCELNATLWLPFCRQIKCIVCRHFLIDRIYICF